MAVSVELRFDVRTEEAIRRTWDALADAGIARAARDGGMTPHVSLGACARLTDPEAFAGALDRLARATPPVVLSFAHLGVFFGDEGVVFAGATPTRELLALHEAFWKVFDGLADEPRPYYRPGNWVPHATLAIRANGREREQAMTFLHRSKEFPLHGRGVKLALVEAPSDRALAVWPLEGVLAPALD